MAEQNTGEKWSHGNGNGGTEHNGVHAGRWQAAEVLPSEAVCGRLARGQVHPAGTQKCEQTAGGGGSPARAQQKFNVQLEACVKNR